MKLSNCPPGNRELWWYIKGQLKGLQGRLPPADRIRVDNIIEEGAEHARTVQYDLTRLSQLDGLGTSFLYLNGSMETWHF